MAIDVELQRAIVRALKALPGMEDPSARTALLVGISAHVTRSFNDLHTDLVGVVRDLDRADPPSLLVLVDNAIERVGDDGATALRSIRARVEAAITPPATGRGPRPAAPTGTWDRDAERRLRGALANAFQAESKARLICDDLGLDLARIDLTGAPEARWFNVVTEARHQGMLDALLARALEEAPAHPGLRGVFG